MSARAVIVTAALLLAACEGSLGRPIVGTRPISDAGEDQQCSVTPACTPVRTVAPDAFTIPSSERVPDDVDDCDADGLSDAIDDCPGVPEQEGGCAAARAACDRLRAGETDLTGADLRGCRVEEALEITAGVTLSGADLSCADLRWVASDPAQRTLTLDLSQAMLTRTAIALEATASPWVIDVGRSRLDHAFVRVEGAAHLRARESVLSDVRVVLAPSGAGAGDPSPVLEVTASDVEGSTVYEDPSGWPGRVRIESTSMRASVLSVGVLDLVSSRIITSRLDASELLALRLELTTSAVRAPYAALSDSTLRDVVFAQCSDLTVTDSELTNIDVPACAPERFHLIESVVQDSRLAGGVLMTGGTLSTSIVGGGPDTLLHTEEEASLAFVTICELGGAAFYGGELRCVRCREDAFMNGTSVCVGEARITERGCPPIELAPMCP